MTPWIRPRQTKPSRKSRARIAVAPKAMQATNGEYGQTFNSLLDLCKPFARRVVRARPIRSRRDGRGTAKIKPVDRRARAIAAWSGPLIEELSRHQIAMELVAACAASGAPPSLRTYDSDPDGQRRADLCDRISVGRRDPDCNHGSLGRRRNNSPSDLAHTRRRECTGVRPRSRRRPCRGSSSVLLPWAGDANRKGRPLWTAHAPGQTRSSQRDETAHPTIGHPPGVESPRTRRRPHATPASDSRAFAAAQRGRGLRCARRRGLDFAGGLIRLRQCAGASAGEHRRGHPPAPPHALQAHRARC